jgi:hypothetical protein
MTPYNDSRLNCLEELTEVGIRRFLNVTSTHNVYVDMGGLFGQWILIEF